jgi:hypothetical protein
MLEDEARRGVTKIVLAYKSWRRDSRRARAANDSKLEAWRDGNYSCTQKLAA